MESPSTKNADAIIVSKQLQINGATHRTSQVNDLNKGAANLPLVNSGKVTNRGAELLTREAFRPLQLQVYYTMAQWITATRESPRHGDPSHKKQLLPHCRRSMTTAFCSSPVFRTQEPSNHWSQQLPEVPPPNSDETITSAPRPPTDLTTETEPRMESPNTSQLLNSNCTHYADRN